MQERILVYGGTGSGKSTSWLTIARQHQIDLSKSIFYCVDTDKSTERLLGTEFKDIHNVKVIPARTWETAKKALEELAPTLTKDDWLIIDKIDPLWSFVQNYFTQNTFHKSIDEYFLQLRKSLNGGSKLEAFKGWTDWNVMNATYQALIDPVMYDYDYNIFITAKSKDYDPKSDTEDVELKESFSVVGHQPEGEKRNADRCHTVLYFNHDINGYYATTVKDRGRKQLKEFPFKNFAETYNKIINDEMPTMEVNEIRDAANKEQQYKTFGKWLDKNHVRWTEAREILGIGENDEIVDYHVAQNKIKEAKGIT